MPLVPNKSERRLYQSLKEPENERGEDIFKGDVRTKVLGRAAFVFIAGAIVYCSVAMLFEKFLLVAAIGSASAAGPQGKSTTKVPQYFQTSPELWAGPTATGRPPNLAQTNPVSFAPSATFVPNTPLETAMPIVGARQNESIFQLMGQLSPYFPNPVGFGVAEYPLPEGAKIVQVQVSCTTLFDWISDIDLV
jgi:hypothetical protein